MYWLAGLDKAMSRVTENIERLVVRSLDGALTPDEAHELNRALIRDPEARRLCDEYRAVDRLAGGLLGETRTGHQVDLEAIFAAPIGATHSSRRASWRFHRGWLMIPGAIAAGILAMILPQPALTPTGPPSRPAMTLRTAPSAVSQGVWPVHENGMMRPVSTMPRVRSDTGREVIGVVGEDGNLYWIEVDRTRTICVPASSEAGRSGSDMM
jgi:anti-sigma factor RsiW